MMHMSKAAIYDQLTSEYGEKFPAEAAQYAIDNMEADFKDNALKKAESYSKTMHMSKAAIYAQLTSEYGEKFTEEEAQYAVDNLVADYKENALAKAKSYQETMNMSKSAISFRLELLLYGGIALIQRGWGKDALRLVYGIKRAHETKKSRILHYQNP